MNLALCISVFLVGFCLRGIVDSLWQCHLEEKEEKDFLHTHPLCASCQRKGQYRKAEVIWVMTNGEKEARCKECATGKVL